MVKLRRVRRALKQVPVLVSMVRAVRARFDPAQRGLRELTLSEAAQLVQPSNVTREDRWPQIFSFVRLALATIDAPRILSFGCATGEEVFTLRRYFPTADLVGIDINPHNIRHCLRRLAAEPDDGIRFKRAASVRGEAIESFDAIFCMAVLRHGALQAERPERCDAYISFTDVDRLVTELAGALKPGGLIAFWSSHFRFADMSVAGGFDVALSMPKGARFNTPLYGPDDIRLPDAPPYCEAIFRKR